MAGLLLLLVLFISIRLAAVLAKTQEQSVCSGYSFSAATYSFDVPLYYSHIHYTGGTAFCKHLKAVFKDGEIAMESLPSGDFLCNTNVLQQSFAPGVRVAFGHSLPNELKWKCKYSSDYHPVTILRDPVDWSLHSIRSSICRWLWGNRRADDHGQPLSLDPAFCDRPSWHSMTQSNVSLVEILALVKEPHVQRQMIWVAQAFRGTAALCNGFYDKAKVFEAGTGEVIVRKATCTSKALLEQAKSALKQMVWFGISEQWSDSLCLFHHVSGMPWPQESNRFCSRHYERIDGVQKICPVAVAEERRRASLTNRFAAFLKDRFPATVYAPLQAALDDDVKFHEFAVAEFSARLTQARRMGVSNKPRFTRMEE